MIKSWNPRNKGLIREFSPIYGFMITISVSKELLHKHITAMRHNSLIIRRKDERSKQFEAKSDGKCLKQAPRATRERKKEKKRKGERVRDR